MPVSYSGVIAEHRAVRRDVGLFDVSHMGEVAIGGAQALGLLQRLTCNDVARLDIGRVQYSALTTPEGTFVDDVLVYRRGPAEYMVVLNAANTAKDLAWIREHGRPFDAEIRDISDATALIAVQGPKAAATVQPLAEAALDGLKYYRSVETRVDGVACLLSRTGYTGEDGFELFVPPNEAPRLWQALSASGAAHGAVPVGLAARDTLRLEAKMALYGNDIDDTTTVLEADLGWIVQLGKGEFLGRDVLARQAEQGVERKLVGFEMDGRAIARSGFDVHHGGRRVGRVTSGSFAPFLEKSIGLAYLPLALCAPGSTFEVDIRGRHEAARVVPTPFYRRPR
jgi:aminomethyltransferase